MYFNSPSSYSHRISNYSYYNRDLEHDCQITIALINLTRPQHNSGLEKKENERWKTYSLLSVHELFGGLLTI